MGREKPPTKNRPRWVSFLGLARAYAKATCDPAKVERFEEEFKVRLAQTSYEAACWGALGWVGERASADHLKTLLIACPIRTTSGVIKRLTVTPVKEFEIDLGNAAFDDVVPDFVTLYPAGT